MNPGPAKSKSSSPVNRTKAVEVAAQLFLRQGYSYVSMDEVVRVSGVSKSNIYYHFKNKEELLQAVVQYWIAQYESELYLLLSQRSEGWRNVSTPLWHCCRQALRAGITKEAAHLSRYICRHLTVHPK